MARPSKYRAEFPGRAIDLMREGASLCEVAADLGISEETIHAWKRDGRHKAFTEALAAGSELSRAWWIKLGRAAAAGRVPGFQAAAWIFSMKNMHGWRNHDTTEVVGQDGGAIQITWPLPRTRLDD